MQLKANACLVIKIGSNLIIENGAPRIQWLKTLASDIAAGRRAGHKVVIVSSGAVALGRSVLHYGARRLLLEEKQAAAAAGQIILANTWREALALEGITAAQVLLTSDDTEERERHLNARATLSALLSANAVPIINENDTVATAEIRVGDNDRLAARVAQMIGADTLILFSDIDGLYTADPRQNSAAQHLDTVTAITPDIIAMAGGAHNHNSTGGMHTKITAAQIATSAGCAMIIADGTPLNPLKVLLSGGKHTLFTPTTTPLSARKKWLAGMLHHAGTVTVDSGAAKALSQGKSLLPAGITKLSGTFARGDVVLVLDTAGTVLAKGLAGYNAAETTLLVGKQSRDIETLLGYAGAEELIHRDDYVWLG